MKSKKTFIILTLAFVLILAGASVLYGRLGSEIKPQGGGLSVQEYNKIVEKEEPSKIQAPDFTVYDSDGNEVHLSDFIGKPIVLNFWASWCGPCKMEMPDFNEMYGEKGEELHFLMINLTDGSRETVEIAKAFIEEQGYAFPVYYDSSSSAAAAYGVNSIPTTYFIDAEGNIVTQAIGSIDSETLKLGIDMIIPD